MKAKTKLPYDVPFDVYETLKEDAEKMGLPATQLLIKLIQENHYKLESDDDVECGLNYEEVFKTMNIDQREVMFWYGSKCRQVTDLKYEDISMKLIKINEEDKRQILKDRE